MLVATWYSVENLVPTALAKISLSCTIYIGTKKWRWVWKFGWLAKWTFWRQSFAFFFFLSGNSKFYGAPSPAWKKMWEEEKLITMLVLEEKSVRRSSKYYINAIIKIHVQLYGIRPNNSSLSKSRMLFLSYIKTHHASTVGQWLVWCLVQATLPSFLTTCTGLLWLWWISTSVF